MTNNTFSGLEMLKIAILMEDEGYNFYINGANYTTGDTKQFLLVAAGQEFLHKQKFTKLFDELSANKEAESEYLIDIEVTQYLRELIENQVFDKKDQPKSSSKNIKPLLRYPLKAEDFKSDNKEQPKDAFKDLKSSIAFALKSEQLTVKVYTKMYEGVSQGEVKEILSVILEEEKAHVVYFSKLLKEIVA
jgi:rubrerythrin